MKVQVKTITACLFLVFFTACFPAIAAAEDSKHRNDHSDDQNDAKEAREQGKVAAYPELEVVIKRQLQGRIIRVELDRDWLQWVYKLRLLEDDGRIIKVTVDAKTLRITELSGKQLENIIKQPVKKP